MFIQTCHPEVSYNKEVVILYFLYHNFLFASSSSSFPDFPFILLFLLLIFPFTFSTFLPEKWLLWRVESSVHCHLGYFFPACGSMLVYHVVTAHELCEVQGEICYSLNHLHQQLCRGDNVIFMHHAQLSPIRKNKGYKVLKYQLENMNTC